MKMAWRWISAGLLLWAPAFGQDAAGTNAPPAAPAAERVVHEAIGAAVTVSSTHRGMGDEGEPEALVDGNLGTRWSSGYAAPQFVELRLPAARPLDCLRLHWEQACAARYTVSLSADGATWQRVHLHFDAKAAPGKRTDEITLRGVSALAVRLDLLSTVQTNWGFSLYEIEWKPAD